MTEEKHARSTSANQGMGGGMYLLGFIGAAVYFVGIADSFGEGVIGLLKAIVWPAFLTYQLFDFLGR